MDLRFCAECNADITGLRRCKVCKRNEYYRKQGHDVEKQCPTCGVKTKLYATGECRPCMDLAGLRECRTCGEVKLSMLDFHAKKGSCKTCTHPNRRRPGKMDGRYAAMYQKQEGLCAICKRPSETPLLQGSKALICASCNVGLARFEYEPGLLQAAIQFLENC